ncbi:MAG: serine/threonine-protein kinase [Pseudomonadota bacterium]|nr:serine/threonine-protein kinase [Pseudomonadota bacterium]
MNPTFASDCPRCGAPLGASGLCARCLLGGPGLLGGLAGEEPGGMGEAAGSTPFDLLEEIGRGGMGSVWRARHRALDRVVAVKYLSEALAHRPAFVARFRQEARVLARLQHPRIVAVYDVGDDEGLPYLMMEYVAGPALAAVLPLSPARAIDIGLGVCEALAFAHGHGVVHRDIKPENILLDDTGGVKVADFGIARLLDTPGATATGALIGTPAYLSPEALAGAPPDPRMDLYALGAVLYQCVTGALPVGALDSVGPALDPVVRRALAPVDRRYASAAELRGALLAARARLAPPEAPFAAGPPDIRAGPASLPESPAPARPFTPEERLLERVAALALTAASGTVIGAVLVSVTPRVLAPEEVRPLVMVGLEPLADGRLLSRARFEEGPLLAAVAAVAVAAAVWALLLRHWRTSGLFDPRPDRPVPEGPQLLVVGGVALLTGLLRQFFLPPTSPLGPFVPLLGGALEIVCLALFWAGVLEANRTARPLRREWMLFAGMGIALVPPIQATWEWLTTWAP